jgi:hypothetical protein
MRAIASLILPVTGLAFILLSFVGFPTGKEGKKLEHYTGSNTLSYSINKEITKIAQPVSAEVSNDDGVFYLNILSGEAYQNRITFVLDDKIPVTGTYLLNKEGARYVSFQYPSADCLFTTDEYYDGILMIHHYDAVRKIIAGSFEFIAHSSSCDELVRVSEGSFDLQFINH